MRSREIPPLKPTNVDLDSHRYTNNNHTYETTVNRKLLYFVLIIRLLLNDSRICFSVRIFVYSPSYTSGQQRHRLSRRLNMSTKRQTAIGSVVKEIIFHFCEFFS